MAPAVGAVDANVPGHKHMAMRQVGGSQLCVPVLGLGCSPLGEVWDDIPAVDALRTLLAAHTAGCRHFDTAPWYGNGMSEARVGMALNEIGKAGSPFTVATKVGRTLDPEPRGNELCDGPWIGGFNLRVRYDYGYDAVLQQHRDSCLRMGLPALDALAIHDLDAMFGGQELVDRYLTQLGPPQGGMTALQELKTAGKIKAIGIGCNPYKFGSREVCRTAADMGSLDYILLAGPYNLLNQEALDDLLPLCRERGMSVLIGAPYASGILATGTRSSRQPLRYMYEDAPEEIVARVARIEDVARRHGVPLPAAALQFPLSHPRVASVLVGVKSAEEVHRAVQAMNVDIPAAFWDELRLAGLIRADAPIPSDTDVSHL